jgi:hypothetical protein|nr:hypothetical protein [Candidatus Krumholzibacteria bacterium]
MKKLVFVFALIALVSAGSAFAQTAYQNNIGVYFDEAGTTLINNDGVVGAKDIYVVLTNLTVDTVKGFECKLTAEGGMVMSYASISFPVNTVNVGVRFGEVIAGFAEPVMVENGSVMVMQAQVIVTDVSIPGELYLDPVYFASVEGAPAFLSAGVLIPANNSTAPGEPVLVTNGSEEPVATEGTSFDNLKSLYR